MFLIRVCVHRGLGVGFLIGGLFPVNVGKQARHCGRGRGQACSSVLFSAMTCPSITDDCGYVRVYYVDDREHRLLQMSAVMAFEFDDLGTSATACPTLPAFRTPVTLTCSKISFRTSDFRLDDKKYRCPTVWQLSLISCLLMGNLRITSHCHHIVFSFFCPQWYMFASILPRQAMFFTKVNCPACSRQVPNEGCEYSNETSPPRAGSYAEGAHSEESAPGAGTSPGAEPGLPASFMQPRLNFSVTYSLAGSSSNGLVPAITIGNAYAMAREE